MRHSELLPSVIDKLLGVAKEAAISILGVYNEIGAFDGDENPVGTYVLKQTDQSPVTQADLLAHQIIVSGLRCLTPNTPVVSEEDEASLVHRKPNGCFWLIDPLDGTREFLSRNGEFTINIALIEDGRPVFGIVLAPCLDLLYWGGRGFGAFREHKGRCKKLILSDSQPSNARPVRVVTSRSHLDDETIHFIKRFGECELVKLGSSLKFCWVAEGMADIYPRMGPTSEWDTAAAQAVLEGAQGSVLNLDREPLHYGKPDIMNPFFIATRDISLLAYD